MNTDNVLNLLEESTGELETKKQKVVSESQNDRVEEEYAEEFNISSFITTLRNST